VSLSLVQRERAKSSSPRFVSKAKHILDFSLSLSLCCFDNSRSLSLSLEDFARVDFYWRERERERERKREKDCISETK
jgi:hypothetical protein